jgi:uncharacterized protein YdhG (YjbR/CyaY superfamily)
MGGKFASRSTAGSVDAKTFAASIPSQHRAAFDTARALIKKVAPQATETVKWGTIAYDLDGSLFALSAPKKQLNVYILTRGVIADHAGLLAGIDQSHCCLRFGAGDALPVAALRTVLRAAVATKTR